MSSPFLSKVSFVSKINMLMKATSDDDQPLPGYIYNEVAKVSLESDENSENLVDFLVDRLQRDSTHVKIKVLKLMKHVVEKGHPNFRLGLLKKSAGIQDATKYSGPLDPLHGNIPYIMVRKVAQSLSEMLFNMDTVMTAMQIPQKSTVTTYGIGSVGEKARRSRMEGFGNTSFSQTKKSLGESIKDGIVNLVEQLGETTFDQQRGLLLTIESNAGYMPPKDNISYAVSHHTPENSCKPAVHEISRRQESPPRYIPGKAGGGWDDSDDDNDVSDDVNSEKLITKSGGSSSCGNIERLDSGALLEFTTEQSLVSKYIGSDDSGSSILLKRAQMKCFLKECSELNCDKVIEFLAVQMSSTSDQDVMRSLMLIEILMNSDLVNPDQLADVCKDGMVAVVTDKSGHLKSKSKKLIRILEKLSSHHSILPSTDS